MIRRPPRSTQSRSSAASDVYKRQVLPEDRPGLGADGLLEAYLTRAFRDGHDHGIDDRKAPDKQGDEGDAEDYRAEDRAYLRDLLLGLLRGCHLELPEVLLERRREGLRVDALLWRHHYLLGDACCLDERVLGQEYAKGVLIGNKSPAVGGAKRGLEDANHGERPALQGHCATDTCFQLGCQVGAQHHLPAVARRENAAFGGADLSHEAPVSYTHLRAHETRHDLVCR